METTLPLVVMQNVRKVYTLSKSQSVIALQDINLRIDYGEFLTITGRSGSGKTTLLNLIAGMATPTSGEVYLDQQEVWKLPDARQARLRNEKIGFIFQFPSLMPSLNVLENVLLPAQLQPRLRLSEARQRALDLLERVDLTDKLHAYPRQLSAGQQQRVVIARSLINRPALLLADEPSSNLDEQTEHEIMALFQQIHRQLELTIVLVTHGMDLVHYGTRSIRMTNGEIVADFVPANLEAGLQEQEALNLWEKIR
jgi:ABC-type lipoprotein export system ATPase subunit